MLEFLPRIQAVFGHLLAFFSRASRSQWMPVNQHSKTVVQSWKLSYSWKSMEHWYGMEQHSLCTGHATVGCGRGGRLPFFFASPARWQCSYGRALHWWCASGLSRMLLRKTFSSHCGFQLLFPCSSIYACRDVHREVGQVECFLYIVEVRLEAKGGKSQRTMPHFHFI